MNKSEKWEKLLLEINQTYKDKHQVISTEIKGLDYILGGGIELGSKIQFVAESGVGKSTLALNICRNFCKKKLSVLYIDTENSITNEMLKSTECNDYCNKTNEIEYGDLVLIKESNFSKVSKILDDCIALEHFSLIIIDSLPNLINDGYTNIRNKKGPIGINNYNTNYESRPLNLFINKYSSLANEYNVAMLYINQYRNKIDPNKGTINKEYGNKLVKYNSDIIIQIKKDKEEFVMDENSVLLSNDMKKSGIVSTHAKLTFITEKTNKQYTGLTSESILKYGYGIEPKIDMIFDLIRKEKIIKNGKYYKIKVGSQEIQFDGIISLINGFIENYDNIIPYFESQYDDYEY